jgi:cellulose synthase/poly-beta-1,6-N-acetylglucosamine synthase-like glycosyltransferase
LARRKFDQYFSGGTEGLIRLTDEHAAHAIGEPEAEGCRTGDGRSLDMMRPWKFALVVVSVWVSTLALLGKLTWSSLIQLALSVMLCGIVWRSSRWLAEALRDHVPVAATAPAGVAAAPALPPPGSPRSTLAKRLMRLSAQLAAGIRSARLRLVSGQGGQQTVRASLQLAIAMSLLWLAWVRPGPWQYRLVVALTLVLAISNTRWGKRNAGAVAKRLGVPAARGSRRTGVLSRIPSLLRCVPVAMWGTISLLILLNSLIGLALLNTARLPFGLWAIHTKIVFLVMVAVDVLFLKSAFSPGAGPNAQRRVRPESPQSYVLAYDCESEDIAQRSRHNGHAPGVLAELNGHQAGEPSSVSPARLLPGLLPALLPPPLAKADKHRRVRVRKLTRLRAKTGFGFTIAAVTLAIGWIGYAHPGPLLVLAVIVVGAVVLSVADVSREHAVTILLAVALGVAAVDYLGWRLAVTNWQGWWIAVPLLAAEAFGAMHVLGFQFTVWPWPAPVIEPSEDPTQREIFILVATLNEGVVVLRPTLEGCIAAREKYLAQNPNGHVAIVVCNDGRTGKYPRWAEIEALASELGVRCLTRTTGGGAKAGNIENARRECGINGTALLAIFDADQVPQPSFLLKTIPPFADPKVGWVQTGQYYANLDNPVSRWADDQQSMFYNLLCPGKAAMNAAFICGTNVVLRAAALDEIGGLPQDSVTEDFAASIKLHPRWRSIYLTDVLATGLGPLDIPSYLKQQGRWALGTLTVFRDHWRDILLPKKNGLRFGQRVQYFLAGTHYLCGLRDLIYLLSPILFVFTTVPALRAADLNEYLLHFLPYATLGLGGMWYTARGVTGLRGVIIGFGSSPALIGSLVACVLRRKRPFAVTSKESHGQRSLWYLSSYGVSLLVCLIALGWATQINGAQEASIFVSLLWISYSLVLLSSFLWLARADLRAHDLAGKRGDTQITVKRPYPSKLATTKSIVRPALNLGLAALVASPVLVSSRLVSLPIFAGSSAPFVITQQNVDARYIGSSLPAQILTSAPPRLERDLGVSFSIIGRTQDITDSFDVAWADKLAAQGARPWITLQFGNFGSGGNPPLTANLPAIYNGVDDNEIGRWAVEIRDYGRPVYLTVLLHADKNWAVSSGVAHGGIPEDVPKAWLHIQSVFRALGANNVAWVWAPADPLHDQLFAPPPSSINVVLQDFINYPRTRWGNPAMVLHGLANRYPGKPLFVEVSVSGAPAEKSAWLARLGHALANCHQLYALFYHEGGAALEPTSAQIKSWSETSDLISLAEWKHIVTTLRTAESHGNLRRAAACRFDTPGACPPAVPAMAYHRGPRPAGGRVHRDLAQYGVPR